MIRLIGDRVLVALRKPPDEIKTASGIVLTKDPDYRKLPTDGVIVQLGERPTAVNPEDVLDGVRDYFEDAGRLPDLRNSIIQTVEDLLRTLKPAPYDVAVGDRVIFAPGVGEEFEDGGIDYVVLRERDILAVLEPDNEVAA